VHRDGTSGSLFRSFQRLEEYSQLLEWIAKAKVKGPFTLQMVYQCQLNEEAAQDPAVTVGEEFCRGVWTKRHRMGRSRTSMQLRLKQ
jgi:hypothetical protein